MKPIFQSIRRGFTLVELLVVIAIIAIMMAMAASVLRDPGSGRTLDSGVDMLTNMIAEARATAQGNDTYARLVIASDPSDTSQNSRHLRYAVVQIFRKSESSGTSDSVEMKGEWVSTSAGALLPPGIYFSPTYSRALNWADGAADRLGTTTTNLSRNKRCKVYYFEFDEKGRYVSPGSSVSAPSKPHRIVLINARRAAHGRDVHDGIIALQLDSKRLPMSAKGLVIWPNGYTTAMRTHEQIFSR